jgi:DNA-binding MarR family transcriptional regulator
MKPMAQENIPSLLFLSNRVARLLTQCVLEKTDLEEMGLQPQHMGVLSDLWQNDGLRQQDLAVSLIKDKGTITRIISFLEEKNILIRVADSQDKRTKRIYLTHKGKQLRQHLVPQAEQATKDATANIDKSKLQTCVEVLNEIYDYLNSCNRND